MAGRNIAQFSAGLNFACAVDSAGLLYCWGYGSNGELGNNSTAQSNVPVAVTTAGTPMAGRTIAQISAGSQIRVCGGFDRPGLLLGVGRLRSSWGTTRPCRATCRWR